MALGAVHVTVLIPLEWSVVTVGADGVAGIVEGVTLFDAGDMALISPAVFWALIVKVIGTPIVPVPSNGTP